jgi:hypothetical protein
MGMVVGGLGVTCFLRVIMGRWIVMMRYLIGRMMKMRRMTDMLGPAKDYFVIHIYASY